MECNTGTCAPPGDRTPRLCPTDNGQQESRTPCPNNKQHAIGHNCFGIPNTNCNRQEKEAAKTAGTASCIWIFKTQLTYSGDRVTHGSILWWSEQHNDNNDDIEMKSAPSSTGRNKVMYHAPANSTQNKPLTKHHKWQNSIISSKIIHKQQLQNTKQHTIMTTSQLILAFLWSWYLDSKWNCLVGWYYWTWFHPSYQ